MNWGRKKEEKTMRRKVTRRDFMKGAAIVAASGLLAGCSGGEGPAPRKSPRNRTATLPVLLNRRVLLPVSRRKRMKSNGHTAKTLMVRLR